MCPLCSRPKAAGQGFPRFQPIAKLRDSANKCRGNQEGGERKNSSVALLSPPHHISGIQSEVVYGLSASRQRGAEPLDADAGALTLSKTLTFVLRHQIQSSREGRQLTFKICLHTFTILPCSQRYHSLDFPPTCPKVTKRISILAS